MVPVGDGKMNCLKKLWAMIRYRNRIMKHLIVMSNLKVQIDAEWKAVWVTIDLIKKESE